MIIIKQLNLSILWLRLLPWGLWLPRCPKTVKYPANAHSKYPPPSCLLCDPPSSSLPAVVSRRKALLVVFESKVPVRDLAP